MIKALVVKKTRELAPKSHNLAYLAELAALELTGEQSVFIAILMKYQMEGRYPDYYPKMPALEVIHDYLQKSKTLKECLRSKL